MKTSQTFQKLMQYVKPYRLFFVLSILLAIVAVVTQLYIPILFGQCIDCMISQGHVDLARLATFGSKIGILIMVNAIATWFMNVVNNHMAFSIVKDMRAQIMRQIQHLPLSFLDGHGIGDILGRMIADVDQISDGLLLGFTQLFSGVITIVVTIVFMFRIDFWISLLIVLMSPASFFVAKWISKHSYRMFQKMTQTREKLTAYIEEMVGNEKIIQSFGYGQRASHTFQNTNQDLQDYSQKAIFYSSLTNPSTRFMNSLMYAVVVGVGSIFILQNALTVGSLSVLLSYANQYMRPFNDISSVVTEFQNALACANRVFEIMDAPQEPQENPNDLIVNKESVDWQDVNFSYVPSHPLIQHVSFQVQPGQKIAIVGPTGCGKTTMINLLMRFYDIDSGAILIDGTDIRNVNRHSLRQQFGMVLQDTWIKEATVRENLCMGKIYSEDEIEAACQSCRSWDFIETMPNGLDTKINVHSLSQGQQQLLCITRVMLIKPKMLILDEATSNIDTRTEVLVQQAFDTLMKGRTSFVIAHRLSTIINANQILVMKDGQIIKRGKHDELLAQNGFYANLYNSQFEQIA